MYIINLSVNKNSNLTYEQRKAYIEERKEKKVDQQDVVIVEDNEERRKKLTEVRTRNQIFN